MRRVLAQALDKCRRTRGRGRAGNSAFVRRLIALTAIASTAVVAAAAAAAGSTVPSSHAAVSRRPSAASRRSIAVPPTQAELRRKASARISGQELMRARRSSRAYVDLSGARALALAGQGILREARQAAYEPLMLRPGERVARFVDSRHAIVREAPAVGSCANVRRGGRRKSCAAPRYLTAVSTVPMFVRRGGTRRIVNLSLRKTTRGLAPSVPLVPVTLTSVAGGVTLDKSDVAVGLQGAFGNFQKVGNVAWAANALPDTDVVVEPIAVGAEMWLQLRSPRAPADFRLPISAPAGTMLKPAPGGAVSLAKGRRTLMSIPAVSATDAAGNPVQASLAIEGDSLVVHVRHREAGVVYPVSVDPIYAANSCDPDTTVQASSNGQPLPPSVPGPRDRSAARGRGEQRKPSIIRVTPLPTKAGRLRSHLARRSPRPSPVPTGETASTSGHLRTRTSRAGTGPSTFITPRQAHSSSELTLATRITGSGSQDPRACGWGCGIRQTGPGSRRPTTRS